MDMRKVNILILLFSLYIIAAGCTSAMGAYGQSFDISDKDKFNKYRYVAIDQYGGVNLEIANLLDANYPFWVSEFLA
jgi:hypothetical protein